MNSYGPRIITDGLVLCLDAADKNSYPGTGTTWYDLSGKNHNATLINTPTYYPNYNGEFYFTGSSSENASVSYTSNLAPTSQITFESFAHIDANQLSKNTNMRLLSKTEAGGYQLGINEGSFIPAGYIGVLAYIGGGYRNAKIQYSSLSDTYHLYSGTFDGRYLRFYVDGVNVNTYDHGSTSTISYAASNAFIIAAEAGGGSTAAGQYLSGFISITRVYNRALSSSEILQNYNATKGRFK